MEKRNIILDVTSIQEKKGQLTADDSWNELLLDYEEIIGIEGMQRQLKAEVIKKQKLTSLLSKNVYQQLELIVNQLDITLENVFELAWGVLLQRYNNVDDVVFGELYQYKWQKKNYYKNYIYPVRVKIDEYSLNERILKGLAEQIDKNRNHSISSFNNKDFAEALFDTVIMFLESSKKRTELCEEYESIPYSIMLAIFHMEEQIEVNIIYDASRFQKEEMNYVMKVLLNIISDIVWNPEKRVSKIQTLSKEMYDDMILKFNHKIEELKNETVIELFREHVANNPNKPAVYYGHERMTYQELDIASDRVAYRLKKTGIRKNDFVALYTQSSFQMIVAMLAVLKLGAAFLPIHLDTPKERFEYMLNDCSVKTIIIYIKEQIPIDLGVSVKILDLSKEEEIFEKSSLNENVISDDVAFVTYTSGTTGKPKGVVASHRSLLSAVLADIDNYKLNDSDIILQYSNYTYVQAMLDIFAPLVAGGTICLISSNITHNLDALEKYCSENHVTKATFTPAILNALNPKNLEGVRVIDTTGEPADVEVLKRWLGNHDIYNSYGTTEVVANTSTYHYTGDDIVNVPIGKPSKFSSYYILDRHENLCGVGMIGELCIGGITLSKGYRNNQELTNQKFVINPYSGDVVYRTGDLARWNMDGNVECLKRIDDQVKVNGRRIELEEIRVAFRRMENINDCSVFAKEDHFGNKKIYAFYTCDGELSKDEVREKLSLCIPAYMIPAYIEHVSQIPVNKNGKVDKRALLDLVKKRVSVYKAPVTEEEILVEKIFCEVFHLKNIGRDVNLYHLGGDSMSAIQISSRLLAYNYMVTAAEILQDMTIQKIAERLNLIGKGKIDSKEMEKDIEEIDNQVSDIDLSIINSMF